MDATPGSRWQWSHHKLRPSSTWWQKNNCLLNLSRSSFESVVSFLTWLSSIECFYYRSVAPILFQMKLHLLLMHSPSGFNSMCCSKTDKFYLFVASRCFLAQGFWRCFYIAIVAIRIRMRVGHNDCRVPASYKTCLLIFVLTVDLELSHTGPACCINVGFSMYDLKLQHLSDYQGP